MGRRHGRALRIDPRRDIPERFVPRRAENGEATRGVVTDGGRVWVLTVAGRSRQLDARTAVAVNLTFSSSMKPVPFWRIDRRADRSR